MMKSLLKNVPVIILAVLINIGAAYGKAAVSLPYLDWYISLELPGYQVMNEKLNNTADKRSVTFYNEHDKFAVTVYINIDPNSDNIQNCRLYYLNILKPNFVSDRSIEFHENDPIAYWNFFVEEFEGKQVNHKNVNACMVRDSACINIHISKVGYTDRDQMELDRIISSIRFAKKDVAIDDSTLVLYRDFALTQDEALRHRIMHSDSSLLSMLAYIHSVDSLSLKMALVQKFLDMKPKAGTEYAYFELGALYLVSYQLDKAEIYFTEALRSIPGNHNLYFLRGLTYLNKGQNENAASDFSKALELKENFEIAFLNRGIASYRMNNYDDAVKDFDSVVDINPKNAEAIIYKGFILRERGQKEASEKLWKEALEIDPSWAEELEKYK